MLRKVLPGYLSAIHLPYNVRLISHSDTPPDLAEHFIIIERIAYDMVREWHRDRAKAVGEAIIALEQWTPSG